MYLAGLEPPIGYLEILLSRLLWPSVMVRERAAVAIADLIMRPGAERSSVRDALLTWISRQNLESAAALGLVVFCRVAEREPEQVPSLEVLTGAVRKPSLLSLLLLRELHGTNVPAPAWSTLTFGAAPADFVMAEFFAKYRESFLPPIYTFAAKWMERRKGVGFSRQWAYEWHRLLDQHGRTPSARSLDLMGRQHGDHLVIDVDLSEFYRSAYLRALACGIATGSLPQATAAQMAAETCPIDLALWHVRPGRPPEWWPRPDKPPGKIDTVPGQVWHRAAALWQQQQETTPGEVVLAADGRVHEGEAVYDLSIRGVFQVARGTERGDLQKLFEDCEEAKGEHDAYGQRFEGRLKPRHPASFATGSGDWAVVPASVSVHSTVSSRWQLWRGFRGIRVPSPFLGEEILTFRCADAAVEVLDGGNVMATWSDWTDGLREELTANLPPRTGWVLRAQRCVVEQFARESGAVFAWLCRLTGYHRRHDFEPFDRFVDHQVFGATSLIIPH